MIITRSGLSAFSTTSRAAAILGKANLDIFAPHLLGGKNIQQKTSDFGHGWLQQVA